MHTWFTRSWFNAWNGNKAWEQKLFFLNLKFIFYFYISCYSFSFYSIHFFASISNFSHLLFYFSEASTIRSYHISSKWTRRVRSWWRQKRHSESSQTLSRQSQHYQISKVSERQWHRRCWPPHRPITRHLWPMRCLKPFPILKASIIRPANILSLSRMWKVPEIDWIRRWEAMSGRHIRKFPSHLFFAYLIFFGSF